MAWTISSVMNLRIEILKCWPKGKLTARDKRIRACIKRVMDGVFAKPMKTMKLIMAAMLFAMAASGASTNKLGLTWDFDPSVGTNETFYIYSNTNVYSPWLPLTSITYSAFTNNATNGIWGRVPVLVADDVMRYYVVTCSNFTGESSFSEPASVRHSLPGTGVVIGAF
jgi:hypothetical protein